MVKKEELCPDAQRLLCEGVPLRALGDGTRYFLYPMNKTDYNIVIDAIKQLREAMSKMSYQNAQIKLNQFVHTWGFNPFKEGAFMGETKIKSDEDFKIVETLLENDPRKVYIQAWGGGNTAAKAFQKLKTQYPSEYERAVKKAVMYNIWYQDGAGNYIETYHPDVTLLVSYYFSGTWDYGSQRYTDGFAKNYLHNDHGPLAALYPQDYISEGDSPAFLYTLGSGLRGYEDPTYGGWGGQFYKIEGLKNVYRDVDRGSYLRWVEVANRDFESRLRWCVAGKYEDANHKPVIAIPGGLEKTVKSGETVTLNADITEPDSLDIDGIWAKYSALYEQLGFNKESFVEIAPQRYPKYNAYWWQYKEAGTYNGYIDIVAIDSGKSTFVAPKVDKPETLHLILEVTDTGIPALTTFARVIVTIFPTDK